MSRASKKTSSPPMEANSPCHEEIADRAYQIWIDRGSEHGGHERDWLQAEEELRSVESGKADSK